MRYNITRIRRQSGHAQEPCLPGPFDQKKRNQAPQHEGAAVEQEEQGPELETPEPEHQRMQNQVGNAGLAAMINTPADGGGGGVEMGPSLRKRGDEKEGVTHGGDDDPLADDGDLTIDDLTSSWNPGAKRSEDRQIFLEPMPDDELPPEESDYFDVIRAVARPWDMSASWTIDALLQPTPQVVGASLTDWATGISRWASPGLAWRAAAALLRPPAPVLQDPHGRVLHSRARGGAIATWVLLTSPAVYGGATASTSAFVDFCLELDARRHRMHAMRIFADQTGKKIPLAARLLQDQIGSEGPHVRHRPLAPEARTWLDASFEALLDLQDPGLLIPDLVGAEPEVDPDDPLGLDAIMKQMTGGGEEPDAPLYKAAVQAAERFASVAARTRVRYAGLAMVVAEVASLWSRGAPVGSLVEAIQAVDQDVAELLQLLVEIARAAQKRQVEPAGLRAGLTRAARRMKRLRRRANDSLAAIVGGILPGQPELPPLLAAPDDRLGQAIGDGEPAAALDWLRGLPPSLDRTAAICFARAASGEPAQALLRPTLELRKASAGAADIALSSVANILLGAIYLQLGSLTDVHRIAAEQLETGRHRRNGILVAEAALLTMEAHYAAGDLQAARAYRIRAGNLLWRMGAQGALSILARWTPPPDDDGLHPQGAH